MTTVDWTPVLQAGVGALAAVIPPSIALFVAWLKAHNHAVLASAARAAGGVAYDSLASASRTGALDWDAARATAIQEGLQALQTITQEKTTPAHEALVVGSLGDHLAVDPSVAVAGSTAVASAAPGGTAIALTAAA